MSRPAGNITLPPDVCTQARRMRPSPTTRTSTRTPSRSRCHSGKPGRGGVIRRASPIMDDAVPTAAIRKTGARSGPRGNPRPRDDLRPRPPARRTNPGSGLSAGARPRSPARDSAHTSASVLSSIAQGKRRRAAPTRTRTADCPPGSRTDPRSLQWLLDHRDRLLRQPARGSSGERCPSAHRRKRLDEVAHHDCGIRGRVHGCSPATAPIGGRQARG